MDSDDLASLTAGRAATLIADGALSPVDLLESCLARIAARDAEIRAWVYVDDAGARAVARDRRHVREPERAAVEDDAQSVHPFVTARTRAMSRA